MVRDGIDIDLRESRNGCSEYFTRSLIACVNQNVVDAGVSRRHRVVIRGDDFPAFEQFNESVRRRPVQIQVSSQIDWLVRRLEVFCGIFIQPRGSRRTVNLRFVTEVRGDEDETLEFGYQSDAGFGLIGVRQGKYFGRERLFARENPVAVLPSPLVMARPNVAYIPVRFASS